MDSSGIIKKTLCAHKKANIQTKMISIKQIFNLFVNDPTTILYSERGEFSLTPTTPYAVDKTIYEYCKSQFGSNRDVTLYRKGILDYETMSHAVETEQPLSKFWTL